MDHLQVVLQFLKEEGYHETFELLQKEAETTYKPENLRQSLTEPTHLLRSMTADTGLSLAMKLPLRNSPTRYHFQGPATVWPFSCMSNLYNASAPRMYPRNCGHHNTEISLPPPSICCVD